MKTFELCEISAWLNLTWIVFTYLYARNLIFQVRNLVSFLFPGRPRTETSSAFTPPYLNRCHVSWDIKQSSREKLSLIYCLNTSHRAQGRDWQIYQRHDLIVWFLYQWCLEWKRERTKMSARSRVDWLTLWPVILDVRLRRPIGASQAGAYRRSGFSLQKLSNIVCFQPDTTSQLAHRGVYPIRLNSQVFTKHRRGNSLLY